MIRSESRGSLRMLPVGAAVYNKYAEYPSYYAEKTSDAFGMTQTLTGWRSKEKPTKYQRLVNPHPCTITKVVRTSDYVDPLKPYEAQWLYGWKRAWGYLPGYYANEAEFYPRHYKNLGSLTSAQTRMIDRAVVSVYAKMKSPKFDGLTNLGELKETIKGVLNPMSGIKGIIKKITKPNKKSFRKKSSSNTYLDHANSQWLEYRYSFMPLALSVQDALKAATWQLQGNGYMTQVTHAGERTTAPEVFDALERSYWYIPVKFIIRTTEDVRVGATLASRLKIDEQNFWGISLMDVPSTAYELLTLSFVLDWFFNVGDWIRAVTPDPSRQVLASSVSIRRTVKTELTLTHYRVSDITLMWKTINSNNVAVREESTLNRYLNPDLPVLPVYDDKSLSWMRQLDAFALSHGALKNSINKLLR